MSASPKLQIVWYKKDLRIEDHEPLLTASRQGTVLPVYIIEPEYWLQDTASSFHWQFIKSALKALELKFKNLGTELLILSGKAIDIFQYINDNYPIEAIYSHQETGNDWTFQRDKQVKKWCQAQQIPWHEFVCDGIKRGMTQRKGWEVYRNKILFSIPYQPPQTLTPHRLKKPAWSPPKIKHEYQGLYLQNCEIETAESLLKSFIHGRGKNYQKGMSSPNHAPDACSRLSPYLANGVISSRQIIYTISPKQLDYTDETVIPRQQINAFRTRLFWRSHFMQKFETMPSIEWQNMHPYYHGIRSESDPIILEAWKTGHTGYPMIDACMRFLLQHGWINFRMRAMLVSFASYNLWLNWLDTSKWLARLFTDYEPGIHYSQFQMQSGTTGMNAPRVYNPIKQSIEQDPDGAFIRQYVPELASIPDDLIHAPWNLSEIEQSSLGIIIGKDYPNRIVDHMASAKANRETLWAITKKPGFKELTEELLKKLTSARD